MKVTPVAALIVAALSQLIAGCNDQEATSNVPRYSRWQSGAPSAIDMAMQGTALTGTAPVTGVLAPPTSALVSGAPSAGSSGGPAIAPTTSVAAIGTAAAIAAATGGTTTSGTAPSSVATSSGPGVTVSWQAPQYNEDGTLLIDLAGFRIRHGAKYGSYTSQINVDNPGATSHRLALAPGLHYVVVSAFDREGLESSYSRPQRVQIR